MHCAGIGRGAAARARALRGGSRRDVREAGVDWFWTGDFWPSSGWSCGGYLRREWAAPGWMEKALGCGPLPSRVGGNKVGRKVDRGNGAKKKSRLAPLQG